MTHFYLVESLSPLVFRAGKPFGAQAYQTDANFPLPSSAAGLIRALYLDQKNIPFEGKLDKRATLSEQQYQDIKQVTVNGLYLTKLKDNRQVTVLVPKPADAIYLNPEGQDGNALFRLAPQEKLDNIEYGSDLHDQLTLVTLKEGIKGKPKSEVQFWALDDLITWQSEDLTLQNVKKNGLKNIPIEIRTHTAVESHSKAAKEGALFQTAGLDLGYQAKVAETGINHQGWNDERLSFLIETDADLNNSLATFGGERRLSHFKRSITSMFYLQ